ncbi:MAG: O-antigen ligase family protein [Desulfotalea sp.]
MPILQKYALYSLYAACFFCLFSSSLLAIFSILMVVLWLASGRFKNLPEICKEKPICIVATIYVILLFFGIFYSPAPIKDALDFFKGYRVLLFIPVIISLAHDQKGVHEKIIIAFFAGYLLLIANALLAFTGIIDPNKFSIMRHGGGFLAIFPYLALQSFLQSKNKQWLWLMIFSLTSFDLFFMTSNRTGWIIYIALIGLLFLQYFSIKKQLIACIIAIVAATSIYNVSGIVQLRVQQTITNFKKYDSESKDAKTSIGVRLDWQLNSLELIKEKPIFGHGTGSYATVQGELIKDRKTIPSSDPHNEYCLTGVQIGLLGVFTYLLLLFLPIYNSWGYTRNNARSQAFRLQAIIIYAALGSLAASWLLSSIPSHIFAILLATFYLPTTTEDIEKYFFN